MVKKLTEKEEIKLKMDLKSLLCDLRGIRDTIENIIHDLGERK